MLALTVWRPWPALIAAGLKDLENRDWRPPCTVVGQRIALHAGQKYDVDGEAWARRLVGRLGQPWPSFADLEAQGVVAIATVGEPVTSSSSRWFTGRFGWPMLEIVKLPEPVRCRGAQKLWVLPPDIERQVMQQVELARVTS